jgi:hypothetical protein
MYSEGSTKGILAILAAILLVVAIAYWQKTLFTLGFIWDLIVINSRPLLQNISEFLSRHWPFH